MTRTLWSRTLAGVVLAVAGLATAAGAGATVSAGELHDPGLHQRRTARDGGAHGVQRAKCLSGTDPWSANPPPV